MRSTQSNGRLPSPGLISVYTELLVTIDLIQVYPGLEACFRLEANPVKRELRNGPRMRVRGGYERVIERLPYAVLDPRLTIERHRPA